MDKIITEGPKAKNEEEITSKIKQELGKEINFTKEKNQFTYTKIDENNQKATHTLSVEDSKFIVDRMTELAKEVANNNMEKQGGLNL